MCVGCHSSGQRSAVCFATGGEGNICTENKSQHRPSCIPTSPERIQRLSQRSNLLLLYMHTYYFREIGRGRARRNFLIHGAMMSLGHCKHTRTPRFRHQIRIWRKEVEEGREEKTVGENVGKGGREFHLDLHQPVSRGGEGKRGRKRLMASSSPSFAAEEPSLFTTCHPLPPVSRTYLS